MRRSAACRVLALVAVAASAGCEGGDAPGPHTPPALTARLAALEAGGFSVDATPLGTTVRATVEPPQSHDQEKLPVLNGAPAHLLAVFGEDSAPASLRYRDRQVRVFPVPEYRSHYLGGARAGFDRRFGALRRIIQAGKLEGDGEIPVFPQVDADQRFRARVRWVQFAGGRGVAFVTQHAKDASAPGPDDLTWVFQGLSDDGAWLVAIFHPMTVTGVPASEDPRRVATALDALPDSAFQPDLDLLARMAASVRVSPVPSAGSPVP